MRALAVLAALTLAAPAFSQTLRPRVRSVVPTGGQRGANVDVAIAGPNLGYGTALVFETPGITVAALKPETPAANAKNPDSKLIATLAISPELAPGRYAFRVVTPLGISEPGTFVVGQWAEVAEKEPNNTPQTAQTLMGNLTVNAKSDGGEDVDVYKVTLAAGETFVAEAQAGATLNSPMEPVLVLRDATGHDRASASALNRPNARLTFTSRTAGEYFLIVRDLRYAGSADHHYRLMTSTGKPSAASSPNLTEVEPSDTPKLAQTVTLPATIEGQLTSPIATVPDKDHFRFTATKGQVILMEVFAARQGSRLDGVLAVLNKDGGELASNDDARGKDPFLAFTAPDNGEFIVRITDLNERSGPEFGYRLSLTPAKPDFALTFAPDCLTIGPGDRIPVIVNATRQYGLDEAIVLGFVGLPPGVQLVGEPQIPKGQSEVTLYLTAAASAALSPATPLRLTGTAQGVTRQAQALQEDYVKNGDQLQRNTRPVPMPLAAVTGPADLTVSLATERLELKVGQTVELLVKITRKPGFDTKVPLILTGLPANVSAAPLEIPEKVSELKVVLKAEANAAVGEVRLQLTARSLVDELHFSPHAAPPVTLNVSK
ncbi:MAG: hypothetical protein NTX57_19645 [Armatimonadetes bacterium]|nr:hypothetical protein [Armatimonadota bacterium]